MRVLLFLLAATLVAGTSAAWACPMQSASKGQIVASSSGKAPSTPIPSKADQDKNG